MNDAEPGNERAITGQKLRDFLTCPHYVWLDAYGDSALRDQPSPTLAPLYALGCSTNSVSTGRLLVMSSCSPSLPSKRPSA